MYGITTVDGVEKHQFSISQLELDSSQSLKVIIEKVHRECNKFIVTQSETDPQITSEQSKKKKRKSDAS